MVDWTDINAVLTALKTISGLAKERKDPELTQQIIELQSLILQLQEDIARCQAENTKLKEVSGLLQQRLDFRNSLIYEESVYWRTVNGKRDGPFCPNCVDHDDKLARLTPGATPGTFGCHRHGGFSTDEYDRYMAQLPRQRPRRRAIRSLSILG